MEKRLGVISIVVDDMEKVSFINDILHKSSSIIVGRMGIPYKERGVSVISLIVDGTTDEVGSVTGKLGCLSGVQVKSVLSKSK